MRPAGVATAFALALAPGLARAHETGISYGDFVVQGARVEVSLRLSATELAGMMTDGDTIGSTLGALHVARGGAPCAFAAGEARPEPPDGTRVTGTFRCAQTGAPLRVSAAGLLSRMSWGHTQLAKVTVGDRVEEHVLRSGRDAFEVEAPPSWPAQAARFLRPWSPPWPCGREAMPYLAWHRQRALPRAVREVNPWRARTRGCSSGTST
jgi:hypothetical protein